MQIPCQKTDHEREKECLCSHFYGEPVLVSGINNREQYRLSNGDFP